MRLPPWQRQIDALQQVQRGKRGRESFQAPLLSFYFKGPTSYKSRTEDKSPNEPTSTFVLASLTFFAFTIFSLPAFPPIAFCEFGSDESRCEEPPLPPTTDLRRQQSASAATRELLREGSPKRRHQKQIGDARVSLRPEADTSRRLRTLATTQMAAYRSIG